MIKLEIGAGGPSSKGSRWTSVDIRPLPGVQLVQPAYILPFDDATVGAIYTRHMIEHLTLAEALRTFREWHRVLKSGRSVEIICPNRDFHIQQLQRPSEPSQFNNRISNWDHGMAGLYGWQTHEHDIHKWAWNEAELERELLKVGFSTVDTVPDRVCDVHVLGRK